MPIPRQRPLAGDGDVADALTRAALLARFDRGATLSTASSPSCTPSRITAVDFGPPSPGSSTANARSSRSKHRRRPPTAATDQGLTTTTPCSNRFGCSCAWVRQTIGPPPRELAGQSSASAARGGRRPGAFRQPPGLVGTCVAHSSRPEHRTDLSPGPLHDRRSRSPWRRGRRPAPAGSTLAGGRTGVVTS